VSVASAGAVGDHDPHRFHGPVRALRGPPRGERADASEQRSADVPPRDTSRLRHCPHLIAALRLFAQQGPVAATAARSFAAEI
jgi:hypothetical protein